MMMWLGMVQNVRASENRKKKRMKQGRFFWKRLGGIVGICNKKTKDSVLDIM
jgi:hypothetical protein